MMSVNSSTDIEENYERVVVDSIAPKGAKRAVVNSTVGNDLSLSFFVCPLGAPPLLPALQSLVA